MKKRSLKYLLIFSSLVAAIALAACSATGNEGSSGDPVVIYTNADEEAVQAMETALQENDLEGDYIIQTFGTSELGGKLLAEGKDTEADIVTMSSYYLDSAQEENNMFLDFTPDAQLIEQGSSFHYPLTVQEGSLFNNSEIIKEEGLDLPSSYQDLGKSIYQNKISVPDINHSSTAWLMIQALVDNYGEEEALDILTDIYKNAGDHITDSGSAPLKSVRAGEIALGAGLRHQAIKYANEGEPIAYQDPSEGTYYLTEDIAILDKDDKSKEDKVLEIVNTILTEARPKLMDYYPVALYEGETTQSEYAAKDYKVFPEALTVELLEEHKALSDKAKEAAGLQ